MGCKGRFDKVFSHVALNKYSGAVFWLFNIEQNLNIVLAADLCNDLPIHWTFFIEDYFHPILW